MTPQGTYTCPRCQTAVLVGTSTCPKCGQPFAWEAPVTPIHNAKATVPATLNRKALWTGLGVMFGIIALGLAILFASGVLKLPGTKPDVALAQKTETSTVLPMKVEPDRALPTTSMPKHILDWLIHLESIEKRRGQISSAQVGQAMGVMMKVQVDKLKGAMSEDGDLPTKTASLSIEPMRHDWDKLIADFRSYPPPPECEAIAAKYDPVLVGVSDNVISVVSKLSKAIEDPEGASDMLPELTGSLGKSSETIDKPASETDALVQAICTRYDTPKWFKIESDYGSGIGKILGGGMIPGL